MQAKLTEAERLRRDIFGLLTEMDHLVTKNKQTTNARTFQYQQRQDALEQTLYKVRRKIEDLLPEDMRQGTVSRPPVIQVIRAKDA